LCILIFTLLHDLLAPSYLSIFSEEYGCRHVAQPVGSTSGLCCPDSFGAGHCLPTLIWRLLHSFCFHTLTSNRQHRKKPSPSNNSELFMVWNYPSAYISKRSTNKMLIGLSFVLISSRICKAPKNFMNKWQKICTDVWSSYPPTFKNATRTSPFPKRSLSSSKRAPRVCTKNIQISDFQPWFPLRTRSPIRRIQPSNMLYHYPFSAFPIFTLFSETVSDLQ
jgi:hypothetical protein